MIQGMTAAAFVRSRLVFYGQMLRATSQVGAFSTSSPAVAEAIMEPIARRDGRALRVLEVGAGTGALTRPLIERLREGDRLDVYEINPAFVQHLREEFPGGRGPAVRIFGEDVESLPEGERYDAIVSTLPLMNFEPEKVRRIFELYMERIEPGGSLTYYDYWAKGLRPLVSPSPKARARMRDVLRVTRTFVEKYERRRRIVLRNVPPAVVHWLEKPR